MNENDQTAESQVVDSKAYIEDEWWKRSEWVIQDELTEQKLIKKGYEPPIHDFEFMIDDEDRTEAYLSARCSVLFIVSRKLETANADALGRKGRAQECERTSHGIPRRSQAARAVNLIHR